LKRNKARKQQKTDNVVKERALEERKQKVLAAKRKEEQKMEERANHLTASLLRSLTFLEGKMINIAIHGSGPDSEVLVKNESDSVTRGSMRTLKPGIWLNDEIINYYLKNCLAVRDKKLCEEQHDRKRSHFFNSFFIQALFDEKNSDPDKMGSYNYDMVRKMVV